MKYCRNPKTAWQLIDDKVVVVTPETKKIHILYDSGARIWEYLADPRSKEDITLALKGEFDIGETDVSLDVEDYLNDLKELNVISLCA